MTDIKFRVYVESILPEETGLYEPEFISGFSSTLGIDKVYTKDFKFKSDTCKFTLLQYTGLKDKNSKDIYEGDIIKNPYGFRPTVVEWGSYGAYPHWVGFKVGLSENQELEVIGNIYENPELLLNE